MRVVILMENTTTRQDLVCEHGLSLYIETERHKILFDAGQTDAFADNAEKLGIDLAQVDMAILSHGHYDHSGGLLRFLQINTKAPVYLHADAFLPRYNADGTYIGLTPELENNPRLIYVDKDMELAPGVLLKTCKTQKLIEPVDSAGLQVEEVGVRKPDDFHHEIYLLLSHENKQICFSGCSHRGIVNIANWLQPDVLFGGFHFMKLDPQTEDAMRLEQSAQTLLQYPATYYTGHCTGQTQFDYMRNIMADSLQVMSTGVQVEL